MCNIYTLYIYIYILLLYYVHICIYVCVVLDLTQKLYLTNTHKQV